MWVGDKHDGPAMLNLNPSTGTVTDGASDSMAPGNLSQTKLSNGLHMYSYRLYRGGNMCTLVAGLPSLESAVQEVRDKIAMGKGERGVISWRSSTWAQPSVCGIVNKRGEYENKL